MVVITVDTTHKSFQGATVSANIQIQGDPTFAPEYSFEDGCPDKSYVECKLGREYKVVLSLNNPNPDPTDGTTVDVRLFIDGQALGSRKLSRSGGSEFEGQRVGDDQIQHFYFAKPVLVTEGGVSKGNVMSRLGTIEIWVSLRRTVMGRDSKRGRRRKSKSPTRDRQMGSMGAILIDEKAKKGALLSSTTSFTSPVKSDHIRSRKRRDDRPKPTWITVPGSRDVIHTFYYKTSDFLEAEGIKEAPIIVDSEDEEELKIMHKYKHHSETESYVKPELKSEDTESKPVIHNDGGLGEVEYLGVLPKRVKVIEVIDLTK